MKKRQTFAYWLPKIKLFQHHKMVTGWGYGCLVWDVPMRDKQGIIRARYLLDLIPACMLEDWRHD